MLHLRRAGLLDERAPHRRAAKPLGRILDWWERSARRARLRELLLPSATASIPTTSSCRRIRARERGLTSTVCFPRGNLAPEGAVIKSTAIDPSVVDADGVYRKVGPGARLHTTEQAAIAAIKSKATASGRATFSC
jgi:xylonate dehydratase